MYGTPRQSQCQYLRNARLHMGKYEYWKRPFIVISCHNLHDLVLLLEQTKDKGANIYTHGEMLPHAYPELKKYAHLKGNFVWYCMAEPAKRIYGIPAAILFAINCIMLVKDSYAYHIFTTFVVSSPDI